MWRKHFAPQPGMVQFSVPSVLAQFFTALLMSPTHFGLAKNLLQSSELLSNISDGQNVKFCLPNSCPSKVPLGCSLSSAVFEDEKSKQTLSAEAEDTEVDVEEAPPVDSNGSLVVDVDPGEVKTPAKRNRKKTVILVESEVRRSPRVKKDKKGFKNTSCMDKSCLGCNSTPPPISKKAIRQLSASLCDIEATKVTDAELCKKKKGATPVGAISLKKKNKRTNDKSHVEDDA